MYLQARASCLERLGTRRFFASLAFNNPAVYLCLLRSCAVLPIDQRALDKWSPLTKPVLCGPAVSKPFLDMRSDAGGLGRSACRAWTSQCRKIGYLLSQRRHDTAFASGLVTVKDGPDPSSGVYPPRFVRNMFTVHVGLKLEALYK